MKTWFVGRLSEDVADDAGAARDDDAVRFRRRFEGPFDPPDVDRLKRVGRA